MAQLRDTLVNGSMSIQKDLFVTESGTKIHGNLDGTASVASALDLDKDFVIGRTDATHSLTVNGNLKVTGDVVYTGTENLRVKDKNVELHVKDDGTAAGTRADADGAGITVKAVDASGSNADIKFFYDNTKGAWTSNVPFDVNVEGTAENAKSAEVAKKVEHKLSAGSGINLADGFDGSADKTVSVNATWVAANVKPANAVSADSAKKTVGTLSVAKNDYLTIDKNFNGSGDSVLSLNLTDVAKNTDVQGVADRVTTLEGATSSYAKAADLETAKSNLETEISKKVDKVTGSSLMTEAEHTKLAGIAEGADKTTVDAALSSTSTNPVQNKVIADEITSIWDVVTPFTITTSVTNSSYEFDGTNKTITVTVTPKNGTPTSVTVNGTAATQQANGTWTASFTKNTQGSTSYPVTASYKGKNYTANPSANAWLPTFAGIVAVASVDDLNVTGLSRKSSNIKGSYSLSNTQTGGSTYYAWFCANSTTISNTTSGGFGVTLEVVSTKSVVIGGKTFTYNCYRSTNNVKASVGSTVSYVVA